MWRSVTSQFLYESLLKKVFSRIFDFFAQFSGFLVNALLPKIKQLVFCGVVLLFYIFHSNIKSKELVRLVRFNLVSVFFEAGLNFLLNTKVQFSLCVTLREFSHSFLGEWKLCISTWTYKSLSVTHCCISINFLFWPLNKTSIQWTGFCEDTIFSIYKPHA